MAVVVGAVVMVGQPLSVVECRKGDSTMYLTSTLSSFSSPSSSLSRLLESELLLHLFSVTGDNEALFSSSSSSCCGL